MKRFLGSALCLLLFSQCASSPTASASFVGTYSLESLSKGSFSAAPTSSGISGTLTLTKDRFTGSFAIPADGVSATFTGPYTVSSRAFTYSTDDGAVRGAEWPFQGNLYVKGELTLTYEKDRVVYLLTYVKA